MYITGVIRYTQYCVQYTCTHVYIHCMCFYKYLSNKYSNCKKLYKSNMSSFGKIFRTIFLVFLFFFVVFFGHWEEAVPRGVSANRPVFLQLL